MALVSLPKGALLTGLIPNPTYETKPLRLFFTLYQIVNVLHLAVHSISRIWRNAASANSSTSLMLCKYVQELSHSGIR